MIVVNLFGGPGSGKSTTASDLFAKMKLAGTRAELVTEYAKDLTYEGAAKRLSNQMVILAEQDLRQRRLINNGVDWVITDSPLLLSKFYAVPPFNREWFFIAVNELVEDYQNVNIFIRRVKPYQRYGRSYTEEQAVEIDHWILTTVKFDLVVDGDAVAAGKIIDYIVGNGIGGWK